MIKLALLFLLSSMSVMAAPPIIRPGGLTPEQIIAQRQGELIINARQGVSRNVIGSRSDEYSQMNPGSGQARFLFNSTVMNSGNQVSPRTGSLSTNNLSGAYKSFLTGQHELLALEPPKPFASAVTKSEVEGMVFLKPPR